MTTKKIKMQKLQLREWNWLLNEGNMKYSYRNIYTEFMDLLKFQGKQKVKANTSVSVTTAEHLPFHIVL